MLIGDEQPWLRALQADLEADGCEVRVNSPIRQEDLVLFCVSCHDGPMPGTVEALEAREGETVGNCAFVLAKYLSDAPPDLMELVELELVDLVTRMMPDITLESIGHYDAIKLREQDHLSKRHVGGVRRGPRMPCRLTIPPGGLKHDYLKGMGIEAE